jgi:hypothetical protein
MESENIAEVPGIETYPTYGIYRDDQLENEGFVQVEIEQLWLIHTCCSSDIKSEQYRQRSVANSLGQLLHKMKALLATPGRMGKWASWLRTRGIPRASADRWVQRYVEAFHLSSESPRESIQEPTEIQINRLFASIWERCEKVLTTERSRYDFLRCYLFRSGLKYDFSERGILLYEPGFGPQKIEVVASEPQTIAADGESEDVL